jgi:SAM-dependent methyltransferase
MHDHSEHDHSEHDHSEHDQQTSQADYRYDENFWEERYNSQPAIWSGRPNWVLVAEMAQAAPGTALDVGCGEGGDAIWLAQQGWTVTAVDFSTVALDRGAARAAELDLGDRIRWVHADLNQWRPAETYDLVSCQYLHLLGDEQESLMTRLIPAVAPGGTFLYVSHAFEDHVAREHPHLVGRFVSAQRLAELLDQTQWAVLAAGTRPRPDAGEHPAGHVGDSVMKAVRAGTPRPDGS